MIKTLRITSIIAAIAVTVLLVLPAVYGVRSDPKIEAFLKSPGAVDKFTATKGQGPARGESQISPLVKQAADLGHYLNPPPPPPPKVQPGTAPQAAAVPAPPAPVAAKFNLVATSYYASHPEKSFVLIDEPGKGLHWVKQGSAVGHLTIETVKDGAVIVRDGQRTSEMTVKVQESWRKLLKNPPPETRPSSSSAEPASPAAQVPTGRQGLESSIHPSPPVTATKPGAASLPTRRSPRQGATPSAAERITPAVQPAPSQVARPGPAVEQPHPMEGGQAPPASEVSQPPPPEPEQTANPAATPPEATSDKQAEMDKLIADIATSKVTGDEAAKMEKLIEALKKMESEPQSQAPAQPDANSGSPEPNTPK
jgi:hypothetical protein